MKKLLLAVVLAFSPVASADWELLQDTDYCIATNKVDWEQSVGEVRFGWYGDSIYFAANNPEWTTGGTASKPVDVNAMVSFDGVLFPVQVGSREDTTIIVKMPANLDVLTAIVSAKTLLIVSEKEPRQTLFGLYLSDMKTAVYLVDTCNRVNQ